MLLKITVPAQKVGLRQVGHFILTARVIAAVTHGIGDGPTACSYELEVPLGFDIGDICNISVAHLLCTSSHMSLELGWKADKDSDPWAGSVAFEVSSVAPVPEFQFIDTSSWGLDGGSPTPEGTP